jgi:hypothetical protein
MGTGGEGLIPVRLSDTFLDSDAVGSVTVGSGPGIEGCRAGLRHGDHHPEWDS